MDEYQETGSEKHLLEKLTAFLQNGCGCHYGPRGVSCSTQFPESTIIFNLNNVLELSTTELDIVILANIQASTRNDVVGEKRPHSRCNFMFQSKTICKETFLHLYGISKSRFSRLKDHFDKNGILPRQHGNSKRRPAHALSYASTEGIKLFLMNYAEENAISLPGRIPGYKNDDIQLLSSCESKTNVWKRYSSVCESSGMRAVCYTKFIELWAQFCPNLVVAKPRTDLCMTCQENTTRLQRACNISDEEKSDCVKAQQEHLDCAEKERNCYRDSCKKAKDNFQTREISMAVEKQAPCSWDSTMHYSFDYAQQVHIPSNPMQPGPIYFKTPRKCGIFGVMCEGIPQQVNFLIDEAGSTGKGANTTISYVHFYFEQHGQGETDVHLHADNCSGQNKNNCFIWYLIWRTIAHLHRSISYSFLIAGHTKFGPDRCFGMIKKSYKLTYISSLYELARMVDTSSNVGVNKAQLVSTHDGKDRHSTPKKVENAQP